MQKSRYNTFICSAFVLISIISVSILLSSCPASRYRFEEEQYRQGAILRKIREKGTITVITEYSPTTYFIYRGEPMGFHYEMLTRFTEHLGVALDLKVSRDLNSTFESLLSSEVELIAMDLTITGERSRMLDFIYPHLQTRQVLVQRKASAWDESSGTKRAAFIRNPLDLANKVVYVQKGSSFLGRLRSLQDEIGDTIRIIEHPKYNVEELIRMVAEGEIDYTVADENVAAVNRTWYPKLDVKTAISFPQKIAWAVGKSSDSLKIALDAWMESFVGSNDFRSLYAKYFRSPKILNISGEEFARGRKGKISVYDDMIKKYANELGWDWRLIAALIYQESGFQPEVTSWSGAFGLMQLMPETAIELGVDTSSTPEEQIRAGIKYLKYLDDQFIELIPDNDERFKFILASYNVGIGHVLDARRLANKYGKDTNKWFQNVDTFLLKKSLPEVYQDPVVYYGYCRGEEPVLFVSEILSRYNLYREVIGE